MGTGPRPGPGPGHQEEITHVKSVLLGGEETKTSAESVSQGSINDKKFGKASCPNSTFVKTSLNRYLWRTIRMPHLQSWK